MTVQPISSSPETPSTGQITQETGKTQAVATTGYSTVDQLPPQFLQAVEMAIAMRLRHDQEASLQRQKEELRKGRER
jgi:hypothetical protein